MCPHFRILKTVTAVVLVSLPALLAAPGVSDPLLPWLQEDSEQARAMALSLLREQGRSPCQALGSYTRHPASRVRESAVRGMSEAGCSGFQDYSGYLLDVSAGVVDALIEASERHLMGDAVPFLLGCLPDRRRIVTDAGGWSIGERAQHALMTVTCQSFHYDPEGPRDDKRNALTRWRQWYLAKRDLPRDEWILEGIDRGRDYAARDYGPYRLEGLRLLALIGQKALPALRQALDRPSGTLSVVAECRPDEPPRPGDRVACVLIVRNASSRAMAIAPSTDDPEVRISPAESSSGGPASASPSPGAISVPGPGVKAASPDRGLATLLDLFAERLIDLPPGETRRFEFTAGPVPAPGRYRLRARLEDLASDLLDALDRRPEPPAHGGAPAAAPRTAALPSALEAETILRFEQ